MVSTFRIRHALAVVVLTFLCPSGVAEVPLVPTCSEPIKADADFSVLDDHCDSDRICGYLLRIPSKSNSVDLVVVLLMLVDSEENDELHAELDYELTEDGYAEAIFYAHEKFSESLIVVAGYEEIDGCPVRATFRPRLKDR